MPLQATSGAASYDAFGGGVPVVPKYIEEYFSTFLFTGNASTQTITNGIDLAGKGGLVWTKNRTNAYDNYLYDTARGVNKVLLSNNTIDQQSLANTLTAFNSTGFTLGNSDYGNITNGAAAVSWSWAKAPKFFDVVTYTGNGAATRAISHSLASTPGFVVIKETSTADNWTCWHRSFASFSTYILLNSTGGSTTAGGTTVFKGMSATDFTIGSDSGVNANGSTYVAYLFAHNAGGFGLTGTDNVISCGSFDANLGEVINLGYEPQWLLYKDSVSVSNWRIADTMRGLTNLAGTNAQTIQQLVPNSTAIEGANSGPVLTSTGFTWNQSGGGNKHIYIAIRRGPMKVPTSGTSVFAPTIGVAATPTFIGNFPVDFCIAGAKGGTDKWWQSDRLRGPQRLNSATTDAESSATYVSFDNMTGCFTDSFSNYLGYVFRRAPSFFDVVCYTGTGSALTVNHNLTVAPEIIIIKRRSSAASNNNWYCGWNMNASTYMEAILNTSDAGTLYNYPNWFTSAPTSTTFAIAGGGNVNANTATYVAYLFATCAGVSKVGSYTGNGTTQTINCGFTGGARFVLIKRTDSTGDWYVWDTARGIVAGNDSYLLLNSTAAEVTNTDYIDTYSAGFEISSTAPAAINASGGSFIFFAVA